MLKSSCILRERAQLVVIPIDVLFGGHSLGVCAYVVSDSVMHSFFQEYLHIKQPYKI